MENSKFKQISADKFLEEIEEGKKQVHKFVYTDHNDNDKIVFTCETIGGILEADKLYEESTGKDPSKQNYVGCQIKEIKNK